MSLYAHVTLEEAATSRLAELTSNGIQGDRGDHRTQQTILAG